ncbi:MAG TPA: hypothetical protein VIV11_15225 [Kofleriaceae bacterium]
MTRKEFLAALGAGAAVLAGCGGDDGGGSDGAITRNCAVNGTTVTIDANHGHVLAVLAADVSAGATKTYTMTGGDHTHMVTVTAANFATLQSNANGSVQVTSTNVGAHMHTVTIICA